MYVQDFENIRERLIEQLETITKSEVDSSEYSYISQLINLISISDDALLFYMSVLLNEISFENAVLPSTIYETGDLFNVDTKFGYPATKSIKIYVKIPDISQDASSSISTKMQLLADTVAFTPVYEYVLNYKNITMNSYVVSKNNGFTKPIHSNIELIDGIYYISFNVDVIQKHYKTIELNLEDNVTDYDIKLVAGEYLTDISVYVDGVEFERVNTVTRLSNKTFVLKSYDMSNKIIFSTEFSGKPLLATQNLKIVYGITKGLAGNVKSDSIKINSLTDAYTGSELSTFIQHSAVTNGYDPLNLIEIKEKIHSKLISRDMLMSVKFDFENIHTYLKGYSKYPIVVPHISIAPKAVVYTELEVNDKMIETNTISISNFSGEKEVSQECVFGEMSYDSDANYDITTDNGLNELTLANSEFAVVSPFKLKYNANLNLVEYFLYNSGGSVAFNPTVSKSSGFDMITTVVPILASINYEPEEKMQNFRFTLDANMLDVNEITDAELFDIRVSIEKETYGRLVTEITYYNNLTQPNVFDLKINDQGKPEITFKLGSGNFEAGTNYAFKIQVKYKNELISNYISDKITMYQKTPLTSPVQRGTLVKTFIPDSEIHNDVVVYDAAGINRTPEGFKSNIKFEITPSTMRIYINMNLDSSNFDLRTIESGTISFNSEFYELVIEKSYNAQIVFKVEFPINISINAARDYSMSLYGLNETILSYNGPLPLDNIRGSYGLTIFQVPVVSYKDWKMLKNQNSTDLVTSKLLEIYYQLQDYVLYGTNINVKFLRTYGKITNIKYNTKYRYEQKYSEEESIKIPFDLKIKIVSNDSFDAMEGITEIKATLNQLFKSKEKAINGAILSEINAIVTSKVQGLVALQFINPQFDIIYDYDISKLGKSLYRYVPELCSLNEIIFED